MSPAANHCKDPTESFLPPKDIMTSVLVRSLVNQAQVREDGLSTAQNENSAMEENLGSGSVLNEDERSASADRFIPSRRQLANMIMLMPSSLQQLL